MVRTEVQKPLTDLVKSDTIARQLLPSRIYLYLNADQNKGEDQFKQRLAISAISQITVVQKAIFQPV